MAETADITKTDNGVDAPIENVTSSNVELKTSNEGEIQKTDDIAKEEVSNDNPYAYLQRSDFTSEKFKIEIRGLPKFYGIGELKKLLNEKLKLGSNKVKPPARGSHWVYVCFRSEEDRQNALKALDGYVWKSRTLSAEVAKPAPDPLVKKRRQQTQEKQDGQDDAKKQKTDDRSQEERLKSSTIPLWNIPYEEQIQQKYETIRHMLVKMGHDMVRGNPALKPWVDQQRSKYKGLPCELWPVKPSPSCDGYRNKCEFTVGINEETGERTVGFRLGSYVRGFTGVGPVDCLRHIPDRMKEAAKVFETFVRASDLGVFNPETHEGYWRQLTARLSVGTGQLMLVVGIHPQSLSKEELTKLKEDLKDFFTNGEGKTCNIASLYFQHIMKRQAGQNLPPLEYLLGETHIHEKLCGLTLRVSPEAFFQINTLGAEVLYSAVAELSQPSESTTLIDICCGTGSIGLSLAGKCGQVLGLELLAQAVDDAKANAANNGITNCDFFVGKAEDILSSVMNRAVKDDILAVVDPPRAGLHQRAVVQLRRTEKLNKLVFLSCDPKAAVKNFVDLGRPTSKTYHGAPLVPVRAVPVDMFPHTSHCELVVYFERLDLDRISEPTQTLPCHSDSPQAETTT
ncbi:tRNA (uracil-5-)-methyltransferase homolog A-like [Periplaneta americana]|uniref:tRNA (uracil-5-)-methyltransferase homolog A-like n=1 Tax=Periplaneta americana TaxID=6978 RepID=UPI0037E9A6C6